jgi:hypothetical protein
VLNATGQEFGSNTTRFSIPMQFDWRSKNTPTYIFNILINIDAKMIWWRATASKLYYVMIAIVLLQFLMLFFRNVGFLPLWTLLEYMQLIAFMPIYNFKLIPYLYDAFKPFLVAHLILFDNSVFYQGMGDEYFNVNYLHYDLSVAKLI